MATLTARQRLVLECIAAAVARDGWPPTLREIGDELGIRSTNGVNDHLRALERKGYVARRSGRARTLRLTDLAKKMGIGIVVGSGR